MSKTPVQKQKSEGSYYASFNKNICEITDAKWRDLIDEQDFDATIFEIREEILTQVGDECYKKYLKNEVYKFLIECSHQALQQITTLHFYKCDDSHKYVSGQDSWTPDDEPLICKPDSWAKGNIPYNVEFIPKNKYQQTDNIYSDYQLVKCEYPSSHLFDTNSEIKLDQIYEDDEKFISYTNVMNVKEPTLAHTSQISVQFTDYSTKTSEEVLPSLQEISVIQPHRIASENTFYKIMKTNVASSISLQTCATRQKKPVAPAWTTIDEIRDEPKKASGQNRISPTVCVSNQKPEEM